MTLYEAVEGRLGRVPLDHTILDLMKSDHLLGEIVFQVGDKDQVFCTDFLPLSVCEDPAEIGLIRKMFEMGGVHNLVADRSRKEELDHRRCRQVKRGLQLWRVAHRMEGCTHTLRGETKVVRVWAVKHSKGGQTKSFLTVLFEKEGKKFGYYFHLKVGLMFAGLL